jgi:hypothetical protein
VPEGEWFHTVKVSQVCLMMLTIIILYFSRQWDVGFFWNTKLPSSKSRKFCSYKCAYINFFFVFFGMQVQNSYRSLITERQQRKC